MNKPKMLEFTKDLAVAVADYYEYTMAHANILEDIKGRLTVFDVTVRNLPTNKVVGNFELEGVRYNKLAKRDFLVNAGLEQAAAYFLEGRGTPELREYLRTKQGVTDEKMLDWVENISFKGDVYAMKEGEIFFAKEMQLRVHERFEEAQVYESLLLNTINPQTAVATTANDIAEVTDKILLEGGSRRAGSPQSTMFNSRATRIGGFHASSNVSYGMTYDEKVGGTHGHSYVMLHPTEYDSFKAQAKTFKGNVIFLLDTYFVDSALETAMQIVKEENLETFGFRIDSGDLLEQAKWIHKEMEKRGIPRQNYTLVASDDLTAAKIESLEKNGADIDKFLIGTYVVNPPKPVTAVYKLAAHKDQEGGWVNKGKLSQDPGKSTLPGIKQVYRIKGKDGYYKKDIIALEGEDISRYLEPGDSVKELLVPIIRSGRQVYDFPGIDEISDYRRTELAKFKDIANYEVVISDKLDEERRKMMKEYDLVA